MSNKTRYPGVYSRIQADGAKVFDAVWEAKPDQSGRRRKAKKRGFRTATEARDHRNAQLDQLRRAPAVIPTRVTVADYLLDEWLPSRRPEPGARVGRGHRGKVSPQTYDTYSRYARAYITPRIGHIRLADLKPADLERLYDTLEREGGRGGKPLAAKTLANVHGLVHKALKDAVRGGMLAHNVADGVSAPRPDDPDTDVWTVEELRAFLRHVHDDRLFPVWLLFATTGMRRGELAGLTWDDIDLDVGIVRIETSLGIVDGKPAFQPRPKTRAGERTVALDPATVEALRNWKKVQEAERRDAGSSWVDPNTDAVGNSRHGLVFTWPDGSLISPERLSRWFGQQVKAAGLRHIRLHDVRHTYATAGLAAAKGWHEVKVISQRLGHASVGITINRYSHVLPAADEEVADTLARTILGDLEMDDEVQ